MRRICAGFLALVFHVNHFWAQDEALRYAATISAAELRDMLFVFASDAFEGRETGKEGQRRAADFLVDQYKSMGIAGCVDGSWVQHYPLKKESTSESEIRIGETSYQFIRDFYFFDAFASPEWISLDSLVFAGFGVDDPAYSDYGRGDVRGRVVLCLSGEPMGKNGRYLTSGTDQPTHWSLDPGMKVSAAMARGARGLVIIQQDYDRFIPRIRFWLESDRMSLDLPEEEKEQGGTLPFFFVSPRVGDQLLRESTGRSVAEWSDRLNGRSRPKPREFRTGGKIHVKRETERIQAQNVLAYIEGSDPVLRNELVVISSHYDHVGIIDGQIHNGADDDGSGTMATVEIAEAFAQARSEGKGPARSVLILNVSGEEKGLLGSDWYTRFPVFPLEQTVCNLNIDMIGRVDEAHEGNERYVYLIGSDKLSSELHALSEQVNARHSGLALDYTYNDPADPNRFYYRSDHYNFAKNGIPVIFYFTGVHEDYHRPTDDPEKILYEKTAEIARLVFLTAWEVANRPSRPVVDRAPESPGED